MWQTALLLDSYRIASEDRAETVALSEDTMLVIVADGVGGRPNGGEAATCAVRLARSAAQTATPRQHSDSSFWTRTFTDVDEVISRDDTCGETTLVVVCATPKRLVGASVGDSEAWWIVGGVAVRLTEGAPRKPYLGYGMAQARSFSVPTPNTGMLLIASDGLFKYTDTNTITAIVSGDEPLTDKVAALCDAVKSSSGTLHDDLAAVLMRYVPLLEKP